MARAVNAGRSWGRGTARPYGEIGFDQRCTSVRGEQLRDLEVVVPAGVAENLVHTCGA